MKHDRDIIETMSQAACEAAEADMLDDLLEMCREERDAALARVAELESQLAAQGWRPGAGKLKHDWYLVYDFSENDRPLLRFYGHAGWQLRGDRIIPNWYMPIPPLPPAPQEPTP